MTVDLVSNSTAATWDYSSYRLIIISSDTGSESNWGGTEAAVAVINGSSAPILGLGKGGYTFFGKLDLELGWPHGGHGSSCQVYVFDPTHQIFNSPTSISISTDRILTLYRTTDDVSIYLPSPVTNVNPLGRTADQNGYYPIISQSTPTKLCALWGFSNSPEDMTQTGRDLFVNLVSWLQET